MLLASHLQRHCHPSRTPSPILIPPLARTNPTLTRSAHPTPPLSRFSPQRTHCTRIAPQVSPLPRSPPPFQHLLETTTTWRTNPGAPKITVRGLARKCTHLWYSSSGLQERSPAS